MSLSPALDRSLSHQAPKLDTASGEDQVARIEALRAAAKVFGLAIEEKVGARLEATGVAKGSREKSLAITKLEEALMWAVKGIVLE